ncbi:hypothetical protein [Massilia sp. PWRC2]|uniref:hypothetical protein n=1 Tax=Massilia sp. PWRC2 TaxID=2804626 RepID=UPI003CE9B8FF
MQTKFASLLELARTISRLPTARLVFQVARDPGNVEQIFKHFTKRHPRYFIIRNKTLGAALVDLTRFPVGDQYLASIKGRNSADQKVRRARARGYRVVEIDRNDYVDDIHSINNSVPVRQGKSMSDSYLQKQHHYLAERNYKYYGTLNGAGKLVAYGEVGMWGNFAAFNRIIGVRNNDGIMYLMVSEIICRLIDSGEMDYLMYDTYFGASAGLKSFKTALGFSPYRARYSLQ